MSTYHYLACDLGAESGRVMLGTLTDGKLALEEIHRFPNSAVVVNGSRRWDVLRLFDELKTGLGKVAARGLTVQSVSTDTWGVDYVWVRAAEPFVTAPYQYRDEARNDGAYERVFAVVPRKEVFAETGIQFMTLNSIFQLHWDAVQRPWVLKTAERFLPMGDYFNYLFSGVARSEVSLASTTQLYNPKKKKWSRLLLKKLGLPKKLFPEIVASGTVLGPLKPEFGLPGAQVVASCSHDTGAAVAAVPAEGKGWAYLSSGTWSLLGVETKKPVITDRTSRYNLTNEVGYGHSIRLLKNIVGLWIVQECRRAWAREGREYNYDELTRLAGEAPALQSLIQPNDARFLAPDNMPQKIAAYCRETNQPVPATPGEFVRCTLDSLALLYRQVLDQLEDATGQPLTTLHIVGGGTKNQLLNQLSANATGRTVITGPVEATAAGNILIQALALQHLATLRDLRAVVRRSFDVATYQPQDAGVWQEAYARFQRLPA